MRRISNRDTISSLSSSPTITTTTFCQRPKADQGEQQTRKEKEDGYELIVKEDIKD